jgi:ribonuclease BN (tRNA processing enzyme)
MFGEQAEPRDPPPTEFHELAPGRDETIAGIRVAPFRVPHQTRDVSLGLSVACGGRTLLFSGDSAWTEEFVARSRAADLFLCECCFYDRESPVHMNYRKLRENFPRLGCKKILLTHLGEEMLAHKGEIDLPIAEDGMVLEI